MVLGPDPQAYGPTGLRTSVFLLDDARETLVFQDDGIAVWADQENTASGMPDLWTQAAEGLDAPFTVLRWAGTSYQPVATIDP